MSGNSFGGKRTVRPHFRSRASGLRQAGFLAGPSFGSETLDTRCGTV